MDHAGDAAGNDHRGREANQVPRRADDPPAQPVLPFPAYAELFVQEAEETIAELFEADDDDEYLKNILQFDHVDMVGVNYVGGASLHAMSKRSWLNCPECRHMLVSKTKRVFCK
jgi:hypothetical protein